MPWMIAKPCTVQGCPNMQPCAQHARRKRTRAGRYDQTGKGSTQRGYDRQWRNVRDAYMRDHLMCERCGQRKAQECHHKVSIKDVPELRLDTANLMALCRACHRQIENYSKGTEPREC